MVNPFSGYGYKPTSPVKKVGGPTGTVTAVPITPEIKTRLERRLKNADDDGELAKVVRDAAKYGVDWSHLLPK